MPVSLSEVFFDHFVLFWRAFWFGLLTLVSLGAALAFITEDRRGITTFDPNHEISGKTTAIIITVVLLIGVGGFIFNYYMGWGPPSGHLFD